MRNQAKYRYEIKYVCSDLQMLQMEEKISILLDRDSHVDEKGYYTIRSLYFDDYYTVHFTKKRMEIIREKNTEFVIIIMIRGGFIWKLKERLGQKYRKSPVLLQKERLRP